jgi:predicted MFS family arabinose efflux permease
MRHRLSSVAIGTERMKAFESKAVLSLGAIMAFRMLGLFMILPIFATYTHTLPGATPILIGVAMGVYGLTQACLQIPFGFYSDKIGRKPIILLGLILFALGALVAAMSHSIYGIIFGRALQGAGAIGSTVLALVADLTRDEHRSQAMAFVGLTIGLAFSVAMVLGPLVNAHFHLSGIFWLTVIFSVTGIALLYTVVPDAPKPITDQAQITALASFKQVLSNSHLIKLDLSILFQHAILMAMFSAIPIVLTSHMGISSHNQTWIYLGVLALAFIAMVPFIIIAEKKRKMKMIFTSSVAVLFVCQILFFFGQKDTWLLITGLFLFFTAFTVLEACLPSLISKVAPIKNKGSAMGIYSSSQFLGIFIGGTFGGLTLSHFGISGLFIFTGLIALIWLIMSYSIPEPPYLSTLTFALNNAQSHDAQQRTGILNQLKALPGIAEFNQMQHEQLLYVKIDKQKISEPELRNWLEQSSLINKAASAT